jgi:hypothetical protein
VLHSRFVLVSHTVGLRDRSKLDKEPLTRLLAGVSHSTITMTNCSTGGYSQRAERLTVIAEAFLLVKVTSIPSLGTFF